MIDLSIIVPLYNTEEYIARCLDSLLDQKIPDSKYEIIVINDGTPDNGRQIVASYSRKYPHVKVFDQTNKGLYITRNRGIDLAKGRYIYFIDSDDFIAPNSLFEIIEFMKEKQLDIFGFGIQPTSSSALEPPKLTASKFAELKIYNGVDYISKKSFRNEVVWYIIDREFLVDQQLLFRNGNGLEDGIFTAELIYHARRIASIPAKIYGYYQRHESTMHTANSTRNRYLLKGYEVAALEFQRFYDILKQENLLDSEGLKRIKSKQNSYIFFLLIRVVKSDLNFKEINELLARLKSYDLYPIKDFIGLDYNKPVYRILTFILNYKILFYPAISMYRFLRKFISLP